MFIVNTSINPLSLLAATESLWGHTSQLAVHAVRLQHILTMTEGKKNQKKQRRKASEDREAWLSPRRRNFTSIMISIFFKDRSKKNVKYLSYLHLSVTGDSPSVMSPFRLQ